MTQLLEQLETKLTSNGILYRLNVDGRNIDLRILGAIHRVELNYITFILHECVAQYGCCFSLTVGARSQ